MIRNIIVHKYRKPMGGSDRTHHLFEMRITEIMHRQLASLNISQVDVYNLDHEAHRFEAGNRDRLVIFANATYRGAPDERTFDEPVVINGMQTPHKNFLSTTGIEGNVVIYSQEGLELAEYSPRHNELNILFDVFGEYSTLACDIFSYIMRQFEEKVWFKKTLENSWKHTEDKEKLINCFVQQIKNQKSEAIESDKYRLRENERKIENYKEQMKHAWDAVLRLRRAIETETNNLDKASEQLVKDLDLIAELPKVKDLHIIDGIFHVWTEDIYAYSSEDKRYYIGECKFTVNMENTDVRFYNLNNPRHGYWTEKDPHPHVNGDNGTACLGSVASTIAELCAMNEIYALVLTCIDFLENANTSDPAGERVTSWDEVDEEGNVIREGGYDDENSWTCDRCEERYHEDDDGYTVYESYEGDADGNGQWGGEIYVCEGCCDEHYSYHDSIGEYVEDGNCVIEEEDEEEDEF